MDLGGGRGEGKWRAGGGGGEEDEERRRGKEEGWVNVVNDQLDFQHYVCDKKCATMDHEGPSMSVIIYIDHQLTLPLMFTSIPGVEIRRSTQVVRPPHTARCNGARPYWSGYNSSVNMVGTMYTYMAM